MDYEERKRIDAKIKSLMRLYRASASDDERADYLNAIFEILLHGKPQAFDKETAEETAENLSTYNGSVLWILVEETVPDKTLFSETQKSDIMSETIKELISGKIHKYDETRGEYGSFTEFVKTIIRDVVKTNREQESGITTHYHKINKLIKEAEEKLEEQGVIVNDVTIAEMLGVTVDTVKKTKELFAVGGEPIRLDATIDDDGHIREYTDRNSRYNPEEAVQRKLYSEPKMAMYYRAISDPLPTYKEKYIFAKFKEAVGDRAMQDAGSKELWKYILANAPDSVKKIGITEADVEATMVLIRGLARKITPKFYNSILKGRIENLDDGDDDDDAIRIDINLC